MADKFSPPSAELEQALCQFDQVWRSGTSPSIQQCLQSASGIDTKARRELLQELVKIDLEYRWRRKASGSKPWSLEDYVRQHPELGPIDQLSAGIIGVEYWVRQHWGDRPTHQEYLTRFPQ